jgi:hypothetical protein
MKLNFKEVATCYALETFLFFSLFFAGICFNQSIFLFYYFIVLGIISLCLLIEYAQEFNICSIFHNIYVKLRGKNYRGQDET